MRSFKICTIALALSCAAAPAAFADTITYATIGPASDATTLTGNIGLINFTLTGPLAFVNRSNDGSTNYFTPVSTYTSSTVSNAPTDGALIAISDSGQTHTFTFSQPVTNLIFSEVSLGQSGVPTSYTFDQNFTVLSCGPESVYSGGCFPTPGGVGSTGNVLGGNESDGTIEFKGTFTTLSFTTANGEYWNGFDIGLAPQVKVSSTPEPSSLILLGTGALSMAGFARRRFLKA